MAASQHIHFTATGEDSEGIKASTTAQLFIDPTQTIAAALTALAAWTAALNAITGMKITRQGIGLTGGTLPDATGKPVASSEVQEVAVFDFNQAALTTHYGNSVPAFLESKVSSGRPNLADTDVAAYVTLLTSAALGGTYSGLGNEALTGLYRAFLSDRKHRRAKFAGSVIYP